MRLIDSHAHLQSEPFAADRAVVIRAARAAGVERILVPGWDFHSSEVAAQMAEEWGIDAAVGVHPHELGHVREGEWGRLAVLAADPFAVAIGETGLDFDRLHTPADVQLDGLRRHLRLALETGKPVILHCRSAAERCDAQDALIAELRAAGFGAAAAQAAFGNRPPGVLHSFSGPVDYAKAALDMGLAIAFGGLVFRKGEEQSAEVATFVPAERLLIETDSPYLAPPGVPRHEGPGFSGRRNSPEWVRIIAEWLCERRGESPDTIGPGLVAAYDATFRGSPR